MPPLADVTPGKSGLQTALFAGGCFWGMQGVLEHVAGVRQAVSGYAGGDVADPSYEQVSSGGTGHAEAVQVTFDPARISYGKLLQVFFSVALDPTQVDRQGPGPRHAVPLGAVRQRPGAGVGGTRLCGPLGAAHVFKGAIATRIEPAGAFYPAEVYSSGLPQPPPGQNPYIAFNDLPKVHSLETLFPQVWQDKPVTTGKPASGS